MPEKKKILVTGGAGFIGSHLIQQLIKTSQTVRVLDSLSPQIHGQIPSNLEWLHRYDIDFQRGSVTCPKTWELALQDVDTVIHLAAETGTGQSMYNISRYFDVNVQGTANMLEILQNGKSGSSVSTLIVASSRAVYGEGSYECLTHGLISPEPRSYFLMKSGDFELYCPECGKILSVVGTDETAPLKPLSIYGLTKQVQEQAVLLFARTNGLNGFALRFQNVYGPGQSLKNPYTGILAVFSNSARQGRPIYVFEDGLETRDFVFVEDVVQATILAVAYEKSFVGALNVGSGESIPIISVAREINNYFGGKSDIQVSGAFRHGDIRHNKATTEKIRSVLKFNPSVDFHDGLHRFLMWAEKQPQEDESAYQMSIAELQGRGLFKKRKDSL